MFRIERLETKALRPRQRRAPIHAATMYNAVGIDGCEPPQPPPAQKTLADVASVCWFEDWVQIWVQQFSLAATPA